MGAEHANRIGEIVPKKQSEEERSMSEKVRTLRDVLEPLRINGDETDERSFNAFKDRTLRELSSQELDLLAQLNQHHSNTLKHSMMVTHDADYIARQLQMDEDQLLNIRRAGLLHDVGKLDIHLDILDLGGMDTLRAIQRFQAEESVDKTPSIHSISIRQVMQYNAAQSDDPERYVQEFLQWFVDRKVDQFLDRPVRAYFDHHQQVTRDTLTENGTDQQVIDIAAAHHPKYFTPEQRIALPKEARILELSDKFNAIIQSEGVRHYMGPVNKRTRIEALNIIAKELQEEFGQGQDESIKQFTKEALKVLLKKHLEEEVSKEIIPTIKGIITYLQEVTAALRVNQDAALHSTTEQAKRMLTVIPLVFSLSQEFDNVLEEELIRELGDSADILYSMLSPARLEMAA